MDEMPTQFRFGSGHRFVTHNNRNAEAESSRRSVNDRLTASRTEEIRRQRQANRNRSGEQDASRFGEIDNAVDQRRLLETLGIALPRLAPNPRPAPNRRRTPGPKAPDSWSSAQSPNQASSSASGGYGDARRWSSERRWQTYQLWLDEVAMKRLSLDRTLLPVGLYYERAEQDGNALDVEERAQAVEQIGPRGLGSYCLSVLADYLEDDDNGEKSWLLSDEAKGILGVRMRMMLGMHAMWKGSTAAGNLLLLFEGSRQDIKQSVPGLEDIEDEPGEDDWDDSSSSDGDDPLETAEPLPILDLSLTPLSVSSQRLLRTTLRQPHNLTSLTSLSLAGSGMNMTDAVDLLSRITIGEKGGDVRTGGKGLLALKLRDLSLAGLGSRNGDELYGSLPRLALLFPALEFLDLSYIQTFPQYPWYAILAMLFINRPIAPSQLEADLPIDQKQRLPSLHTLGFKGLVPLAASKVVVPVEPVVIPVPELRRQPEPASVSVTERTPREEVVESAEKMHEDLEARKKARRGKVREMMRRLRGRGYVEVVLE